ncbi:MAG: carboxypeptidase-like regulatory domain-containing protein [Acidobacteriaceae bacterium]
MMLGSHAQAQTAGTAPASSTATSVPALNQSVVSAEQTPGSPTSPTNSTAESGAGISGTVTAPDGHVIVDALVTLVSQPSKSQQTAATDGEGAFHFSKLPAGTFQMTVTAIGFAPWVSHDISLSANQQYQVPEISLEIASASTTVHAVFTGYDLAEQQMHLEEKQRVLGVFPNFYTSYVWKAEPLTAGQKFRLAWRSAIDPVTFLTTGAIAGIQQWDDDFEDYGQGASGYAKRYGANYADGFIGVMLGGAVFPSILHQDPRYFYKGTGSIRSRALYALSTVVIARGDNGRWQPNYSNVLGTFAAGAISNAYYPANDRGVGLTIENSLIGLAAGGGTALLQEFLIRKISRGVPPTSSTQP